MTKKIHIADDLSLPLNAVTQKFAFLGRTGSGKTYGASKMAEEMLLAGAQVIVIDPMGVWYGLRLDADGKHPSGIEIPVFGGLHGDLPLTPDSGALVADIIVDRRIPAILDVSQMIDSEINRFCTAFGDRFFQRMKARPSPVHLFLEECQEFLPQNIMKGEERKLHVFQRIAKQGRNFGIGVSLISQRPQETSKKALNMTEIMFAFQMTGPQERKAIELWISEKGLELDIVAALPKFKVGSPHVWSPQWLEISKQITIARKQTYDASATPEFGAHAVERRELTPVDVESIKETMHNLIEQVKADDPAELRKQIAALKRDLERARAQSTVSQTIEVPVLGKEQTERINNAIRMIENVVMSDTFMKTINEINANMTRAGQIMSAVLQEMSNKINKEFMVRPSQHAEHRPKLEIILDNPSRLAEGLTIPQRRILDAIVWLESVRLYNPKRTIVAFLAGQSPKSSGFTNNMGALRSGGLITYPASDSLNITDAGRRKANPQPEPITTGELQAKILGRLPRPQRLILQVLLSRYPDPVEREMAAKMAGQSPTSSGYTNNLGALRSLGVIDYPDSKTVAALPVLFLE